jgi:spermidine synthase
MTPMLSRLPQLLRRCVTVMRSYFQPQILARSRGQHVPVRVVMLNGRKRLDGPTVNYSYGTLHTVFAEALQRVDIGRRAPRSVLVLGLGAGSVVALLRLEHGIRAPIVGVEHDAEVIRLATDHFGLRAWSDLEIVVADAIEFAMADRRRFDLVVVDLFIDAMVPPRCRERPFIEAIGERLAPGGLLLFNVIAHTAAGQAGVDAIGHALRSVLAEPTTMSIRSNVVFAVERAMAGSAGGGQHSEAP